LRFVERGDAARVVIMRQDEHGLVARNVRHLSLAAARTKPVGLTRMLGGALVAQRGGGMAGRSFAADRASGPRAADLVRLGN
jgi:hypothetical protein